MNAVAKSLDIAREVAARAPGKAILVGVSGGKDSLVTLDVCVQTFDHVEAYYMELVPGLECVAAPAIAACKRVGVKLHRVPHWDLARMLKFGVLCPPRDAYASLRLQKLSDVETALRLKTRIEWTALGWRKGDTLQRQIMYKRWGHVWEKSKRLLPIMHWSTAEVISYLKVKRIPIPPRFGKGQAGVSGFSFEPEPLRFIRDHHPEDWKRLLNMFPFAGAQLEHDRLYGEGGNERKLEKLGLKKPRSTHGRAKKDS